MRPRDRPIRGRIRSGSSIELSAVRFRGVLLALRGGAPLGRGAPLDSGDAPLEKRKEDYPYIQPEAPVLDVVVVEEHPLFYGGVPPEPVDLRPARDAALDLVAVGITVYRLFEQGYVSGLLGGRRKTPKSRGKVQGAPSLFAFAVAELRVAPRVLLQGFPTRSFLLPSSSSFFER